MSLAMPAPDPATLARRDAIVAALRMVVPGEAVIDAARLRPYEPDGFTGRRQPPMVMVRPENDRAGVGNPRLVPRAPRQAGAARLGHLDAAAADRRHQGGWCADVGVSGRAIGAMAAERPLGAVEVTGDISDQDEAYALAGSATAELKAQGRTR